MTEKPEKIPPVTDEVDVQVIKRIDKIDTSCAVCREPLTAPLPEECPYCGQKFFPFFSMHTTTE